MTAPAARPAGMTERRALTIALALNVALAAVEIVAALWSRSVALMAGAAA